MESWLRPDPAPATVALRNDLTLSVPGAVRWTHTLPPDLQSVPGHWRAPEEGRVLSLHTGPGGGCVPMASVPRIGHSGPVPLILLPKPALEPVTFG